MEIKPLKREILPLKTYILQFIYKEGNGWAFVNARTIGQAETVFKNQTKFEGAKVVNIKETKYYGENIQLVYEGAVTTIGAADITKIEGIVREAIGKYDFSNIILSAIDHKFDELNLEELIHIDLSDYVTKSDIEQAINEAVGQLDLSAYLTRQDVINLISELNIHGKDGADGKDGINGIDGTNGADGIDGVGISNITYNSTNGQLAIYLTDGSCEQFTIATGSGQGRQEIDVVEAYGFGSGSFNSAWQAAKNNPSTMFQWILDDVDDNGNNFSKVIWHIGNGKFIDTLGASVLGHIDGVTIVCKKSCIWRVYNGQNYINTSLQEGVNNFSFNELQSLGLISDKDNPTIGRMGIVKTSDNQLTYDYDSVISIDFGGLTITNTNASSNFTISTFLRGQSELQYIDRLILDINNQGTNVDVCENCTKLRYANVSGNVVCDRITLFRGCSNLGKVIVSGLSVVADKLNNSFGDVWQINGGYNLYTGSLTELDIRNFSCLNSSFSNMTNFLTGQGKLKKLTIGNLSTSDSTDANTSYYGFRGVTNCVLICTSTTPPSIPDSTDKWLKDETFSVIYVPNSSVDAYRTAWSRFADKIFSVDTYINIYDE